jgi:Zn-finger nucleic acid-binding protein
VNCPACGAPITPKPDTAGYLCGYCRAAFYPGEEEDGVQRSEDAAAPVVTDSCPLCSQGLVHARIAGTHVLFCNRCHGLLLPMSALPGLIEQIHRTVDKPAVQAPPEPADLQRVVHCPRCQQRMDTHFYAGPGNVIVDSCGACLVLWLDRGELTRIVHAPDEGDQEDLHWG